MKMQMSRTAVAFMLIIVGGGQILAEQQAGDGCRFVSVKLAGDYEFDKVGVGDVDGDGELEYVIRQPHFNTDPYWKPGYWKKSPMTFKLEAYESDGTMLWRYDMGWAIEAGIWYSPWVVYDVDEDGKAEVYAKAGEGDPRDQDGRVMSGPEWLVKIDGPTGQVVARTPWLSREGYGRMGTEQERLNAYNWWCRNFLAVAYLDGRRPSLIMSRGTYDLIKTTALDKEFNRLWYWQSPEVQGEDYFDRVKRKGSYRGQGSHGLIAADVDGDARDELVMGAFVLDDDGQPLWTLGMGHPDICYVADIDPDHTGLEVFYGFETRQDRDGICVVDAQTGRKLWANNEPTKHLHGQGMCGDVLASYPGMEVYCGERDFQKRWLYSSKGELIEFSDSGSLNPRLVWWDADEQKEVVRGNEICDWDGKVHARIEGRLVAVMDCLGDHREEVVTSLPGEMRIYTTVIPCEEKRASPMADHQYRMGVAAQTMGYYYPAQLGQ